MAQFEGYERREAKILATLKEFGISSIDECKEICDKYGIDCWTNTESFDRDMPIDFFPIKWDKLRCKLEAAEEAGLSRAMTFEFSHFMSPNSCYIQAHGLYKRYQEYINGEKKEFYL